MNRGVATESNCMYLSIRDDWILQECFCMIDQSSGTWKHLPTTLFRSLSAWAGRLVCCFSMLLQPFPSTVRDIQVDESSSVEGSESLEKLMTESEKPRRSANTAPRPESLVEGLNETISRTCRHCRPVGSDAERFHDLDRSCRYMSIQYR